MSQMDKVCMVCGDKALGYNFNAVTCESCKAFFRRNALSSKDFSCPFNETCEITVITRRFCQRCRLQKCFKIGMRKEYIMTEEDKLLKRKKVEMNRAKRKSKLISNENDETMDKMKCEQDQQLNDFWTHDNLMDTTQIDMSPGSVNSECASSYQSVASTISNSSMSPTSSSIGQYAGQISMQQSPLQLPFQSADASIPMSTINSMPTNSGSYQMGFHQSPRPDYPTKDSDPSEIVNYFVNHPHESSNYINILMPNQKIAMDVMTKVIESQKDAMKMIGHLIGSPGDALKIISKIMNSPYHALSVFTKFMSSPNDALEIIAKCVNSPVKVLHFLRELMNTPDNAADIVNKFMNEPVEAMKMLNDMVNTTMVDSTTKMDGSDLNNLMAPTELAARPHEFPSNDTLADTLICTKNVSSPIVRNLLESTYGEVLRDGCSGERSSVSRIEHIEMDNTADTGIGNDDDNEQESNTLEALISDAIKIEYNRNGRENISRELNDSETAKLNELIVAYKALFIPLDEDITPLVKHRHDPTKKTEKNPEDPQLLTLINLTAIAIKRLIKMVKKINAFKSMCQEDQVALLKGSCTEMMILRSIMQYDVDHSTWKIPHNQEDMSKIKSDVLKLANNNVYEEYEKFIRTFDPHLRKDENIILILSAIVLFRPNRPKVVHADVIVMEQNSYYYLLRRYLESVYPGCEAKSLFLKLIRKIKELECLKEVIIAVYLDVNPNQVQPLLREIFDIKNC